MNSVGVQTRVLLVDDHTLFRAGLKRVLEGEDGYAVIGEASNAHEAYALIGSGIPLDLALVDYDLGTVASSGTGLVVLRHLRALHPALPMVLLTAGVNAELLAEVVRTLHASVFLKSEPVSELLRAIRTALNGGVWVSSSVSVALTATGQTRPDATHDPAFTARELKVLRWITEGLSNKQIGFELNITESSAKALLQKLFEKTSVRSRSQLVRYVFESNLELP